MSDSHYVDKFDRHHGTGSRNTQEDWLDGNSGVATNKWTTAETTFWPDKGDGNGDELSPKQRRRFEQLKQQHDRFAGASDTYDRKTTIRYGHILNDVETFCHLCELSDQQAADVEAIVKNADISSNNYGGKPYEHIILAIMSLVVDRDIDDVDEIDQRLILQDAFKELMANNGVGSSELRTLRRMVRERVDVHSPRDPNL